MVGNLHNFPTTSALVGRMCSPIGEGALHSFPLSALIVAAWRGLFVKGGAVLSVGVTAVFGGGLGGDTS
jgi:hypothetical protein